MRVIDLDKRIGSHQEINSHKEYAVKIPRRHGGSPDYVQKRLEQYRKKAELGLSLFDDDNDDIRERIIQEVKKCGSVNIKKLFPNDMFEAIAILRRLQKDGIIAKVANGFEFCRKSA